VRALERAAVQYSLHRYDVGDEHLSAAEVAAQVGQPIERVFKTLVARGDRTGPLFAVVPADSAVDLKALARASGNRRVELVPLREVTALTGYVRGGTTVFAAKKVLPVFLDASAQELPTLICSAGQKGLQVELSPADYLRACAGTLAPIAQRRP
jgi:Cys-tRNA(Pro)/Cys-tRNA(Cys) deacylase